MAKCGSGKLPHTSMRYANTIEHEYQFARAISDPWYAHFYEADNVYSPRLKTSGCQRTQADFYVTTPSTPRLLFSTGKKTRKGHGKRELLLHSCMYLDTSTKQVSQKDAMLQSLCCTLW